MHPATINLENDYRPLHRLRSNAIVAAHMKTGFKRVLELCTHLIEARYVVQSAIRATHSGVAIAVKYGSHTDKQAVAFLYLPDGD